MPSKITKRNLNPFRIGLLGLFTSMGLFLGACSSGNLYEDYKSLSGNSWGADSVKSFEFEIKETKSSYDLFFTIKNELDYSHYNIFIDYKLFSVENGEELLLDKGLKEFILFNPKSGKPLGSGSSGWYNHEFIVKEKQYFEHTGNYVIRFQQYMRVESLKHVAAVGFLLKNSESESKD